MARVLSMHLHSCGEALSIRTNSTESVDTGDGGVIVGAVLEALQQLGWSDTVICEKQALDTSQWSKQKKGTLNHHMSVQRLERLGPEFQRAFAMALCRRAKLRVADADVRRLALSRAIRAIGDAVEALEADPQLPLFQERVG